MEFSIDVHQAGFNSRTILDHLDVSRSTYKRYKAKTPLMAIRAIEHQAGIAPGWEGFYIRADGIETPTGQRITRTQLETFEYLSYINRMIGWEAKNRPKPVLEEKENVVSLPSGMINAFKLAR